MIRRPGQAGDSLAGWICSGTPSGHTALVEAVAWTGDTLASGSSDGIAIVWDAFRCTGDTGAVTSLAFSPDGAIGGPDDKTLRVLCLAWSSASSVVMTPSSSAAVAVRSSVRPR